MARQLAVMYLNGMGSGNDGRQTIYRIFPADDPGRSYNQREWPEINIRYRSRK